MNDVIPKYKINIKLTVLVVGIVLSIICSVVCLARFAQTTYAQNEDTTHLLTVYDRQQRYSFISHSRTVSEALTEANIILDDRDTVEPSRDETLVASEYKINIYRARPVIVVDGVVRTKIMTPYQSVEQIVKDAGISLMKEDTTTLQQSTDFVNDGAGLVLTIHRSIPLSLDLFGHKNEIRTHASTVQELLAEKGIFLSSRDRVLPSLLTNISANMDIRVWREGTQTITEDEPITFSIEHIYDADRPLGYRAIQTNGVDGVRSVTYEIEIKDGQEIARRQIAQLITKEPVKQVIAVGIKGMGTGLTKAKGAIVYTDSKGVAHRETYYDLDMRRVMYSCNQGGHYTVRIDGVKVDSEGYVIIAANYSRYPKCSVVETSVGPGKVYDTGGFASRYPDAFDIATDWSNSNGY